jgi:hypothetical protein
VLAGAGWCWLVLAGAGWCWLVLAGAGWCWLGRLHASHQPPSNMYTHQPPHH